MLREVLVDFLRPGIDYGFIAFVLVVWGVACYAFGYHVRKVMHERGW